MMKSNHILQRHDTEIEEVKDNLNNISLDLQLLIKDHKFLADKMHEISVDLKQFILVHNDVKQNKKEIEELKKNNKIMEDEMAKLKFWHEKNDAFWDSFLNKWLKIIGLGISIISILLVIYFK